MAVQLPHCDICELSAKVVMRGVGLMERDKDYNNASHYLEILLQVRGTADKPPVFAPSRCRRKLV